MSDYDQLQAALSIARERLQSTIHATVTCKERPWEAPRAGQIAARLDDVRALQKLINEFEVFGEQADE